MTVNTKTVRQLEIVDKWYINKHGSLVAATGFGKTYTAVLAAYRLQKEIGEAFIMKVIVPTLNLKDQWTEVLTTAGLLKYAEVIVINTAYKGSYVCDLLVLDEMHVYGAPEFSKVFDTVVYKYIFGLTATIERSDGKHDLLLEKAPIIDTVSLQECTLNNWVSPFITYNMQVPFTPEEDVLYKKANNQFRYAASRIGGFGGETFKLAKELLANGTPEQKGYASIYYNSMRRRREVCMNASNKLLATEALINTFSTRKTLVFSETTAFANALQKKLGDDVCLTFHSKMNKKDRTSALEAFGDPLSSVRVVSSVRALNAGQDIPDCSLGISAAGNSKALDDIQRRGRTIRYIEGKIAIYVNLYVPNTQESVWVARRTKGQDIKVVSSVTEIMNDFKEEFYENVV